MLVLYQAEWCPCSHRVRMRLTELQLEWVARRDRNAALPCRVAHHVGVGARGEPEDRRGRGARRPRSVCGPRRAAVSRRCGGGRSCGSRARLRARAQESKRVAASSDGAGGHLRCRGRRAFWRPAARGRYRARVSTRSARVRATTVNGRIASRGSATQAGSHTRELRAPRDGSGAGRRGIGLASTLERVGSSELFKRKEWQMSKENVVVVRFTEPSQAYQALSVLKDCDASGRIGLESAAVVERTAAGELRSPRAPTTSASSGLRAAR